MALLIYFCLTVKKLTAVVTLRRLLLSYLIYLSIEIFVCVLKSRSSVVAACECAFIFVKVFCWIALFF